MSDMTPEKAKALREPFPPQSIGRLPKGGVMLDYVGHAAVTDRLLRVDPSWTWQPLAKDEHGLPALDADGNLWINLTVCGITRVGVGDGKNMKERISDSLRNAAMRFGVALDLWSKEDLTPSLQDAKTHAWNALSVRYPDKSTEERKQFVVAALEARGATTSTADADIWMALAREWSE